MAKIKRKDYLAEAFRGIRSLNEEEEFDLSKGQAMELSDFLDDNDIEEPVTDEVSEVIDTNAYIPSQLQDSYAGKIILQCLVCGSQIYKDDDEVILSEEGDVANEDEACPVCNGTSGYAVIGKIEPINQEEPTEEPEEINPDDIYDEDEFIPVAQSSEGEMEEAYKTFQEKIRQARGLKEEAEDPYYLNDDDISEDDAIIGYEETDYPGFDVNYEPQDLSYFSGADYEQDPDDEDIDGDYDELKFQGKTVNLTEAPEDFEDESLKDTFNKSLKNLKFKDKRIDEAVGGEDLASAFKNSLAKLRQEKGLTESIDNIDISSDNERVTLNKDDSGKVSINIDPITTDLEQIIPLEDEDIATIEDNNIDISVDNEDEEMFDEDEEMSDEDILNAELDADVDLEDIDEFGAEEFDELGEGFLRKVYKNVDSYRTETVTDVAGLVVEGVIKFKSGNKIPTKFVFTESKKVGSNYRLYGYNKDVSNSNRVFTLTGRKQGNRLVANTLRYNFNSPYLNEQTNKKHIIKYKGKVTR